jgi:hypothetical protein
MINEKTTCNNKLCVASYKCLRYRTFKIEGDNTNPFKFSGNKRTPCTNYIALK